MSVIFPGYPALLKTILCLEKFSILKAETSEVILSASLTLRTQVCDLGKSNYTS